MMTSDSTAAHAPLDEDTRRLLSETTQRLVNHAVERRVEHVVQSSAAKERIARRVWPVVLTLAMMVLAFSIGWLLRGASH